MEAIYELRTDSAADDWGYAGTTHAGRWYFLGFVRLSDPVRQAVREHGVVGDDEMVTLRLQDTVLQDVLSRLLAAYRPVVAA